MSWNVLYVLDLLAIGSFGWSYYRTCYRRGYRIDIWHLQLILSCILPNFLMLPAAASPLNELALGQDYASVMSVLPTVFLITLLGYASVLVGGALWSLHLGLGLRRTTAGVLRAGPQLSIMLMSSRSLLVFQSALCLMLQALILTIYFMRNGFGFDLRAYTIANPELRPVALLASQYSILIASHCLARYVEKKEKILLACTLLLTLGLIFFGARSNLLSIYIGVLLCYLVGLRRKVSLVRIFGVGSLIVLFSLYLGSVRAGEYSLGTFSRTIVALLLFGDTFSDLRDFAWVYADWNHLFWAGKTYLAALLAFVPRFASSFRDTWGLGVATATTAGLDPRVHPGLRPGMFGEGFFNFGLFGVVAVGLMLGIITRRVDVDVKQALTMPSPSMIRAFASTMLLGVAGSLAITASFSSLYVLAGIYLFSWLCLAVGRLVQSRPVLLANAD
jgi:oligosaccharide repeat unit polymerase